MGTLMYFIPAALTASASAAVECSSSRRRAITVLIPIFAKAGHASGEGWAPRYTRSSTWWKLGIEIASAAAVPTAIEIERDSASAASALCLKVFMVLLRFLGPRVTGPWRGFI